MKTGEIWRNTFGSGIISGGKVIGNQQLVLVVKIDKNYVYCFNLAKMKNFVAAKYTFLAWLEKVK